MLYLTPNYDMIEKSGGEGILLNSTSEILTFQSLSVNIIHILLPAEKYGI